MSHLIEASLLAYPRDVRRRDGDHLRDLALELGEEHGFLREAFGLLRGGLVERWRGAGPRRQGGGRRGWCGTGPRRPGRAGGGFTDSRRRGSHSPAPRTRAREARSRDPDGPGDTDAARVVQRATRRSRHPTYSTSTAATVFHASDAPPGSSGSLVATLDGEVVTCQGWGRADHETGAATGCETVYDIGSVTKPITAIAVVKLQMQGRLRVTDPIDRFFDGRAGGQARRSPFSTCSPTPPASSTRSGTTTTP